MLEKKSKTENNFFLYQNVVFMSFQNKILQFVFESRSDYSIIMRLYIYTKTVCTVYVTAVNNGYQAL